MLPNGLLAQNFMPHGMCYLWKPSLILLHVISDAAIAIAYFSIPAMLIYFVYKREDAPFLNVFILFAAFIILCGVGHLLDIWTLWHPTYWTAGVERAVTALVSCFTAGSMVTLLPQFLSLKTPEQLETVNRELQKEIVERTSAETALKQLNEELEARVEERTAQLTQANIQLQEALSELQNAQAQLIQTEKMSSLGQMVAGVAHEVNNPVSFIHGNVTYVEGYTEDLFDLIELYRQALPQETPEIAEKLEEIDLGFIKDDLPKLLRSMKSGSDRIRDIVVSLRKFSHLDESDLKPVALREGIDSALKFLRHRLRANDKRPKIKIVKHYAPLSPVECYPGNLNQAFMNILNNAIDALEERGEKEGWQTPPKIWIHTEEYEGVFAASNSQSGFAIIRIGNNGLPIPESIRSKLFDPFFTTKSVGEGIGLGLSISYQIVVKQHGGLLEYHPQEGQGTEFVIKIPLQQSVQCLVRA